MEGWIWKGGYGREGGREWGREVGKVGMGEGGRLRETVHGHCITSDPTRYCFEGRTVAGAGRDSPTCTYERNPTPHTTDRETYLEKKSSRSLCLSYPDPGADADTPDTAPMPPERPGASHYLLYPLSHAEASIALPRIPRMPAKGNQVGSGFPPCPLSTT